MLNQHLVYFLVYTEAPVTISEATTHSGPKTTAADMISSVTQITTTPSHSFTTSSITTVATTSPHFVTTEDTTYVPPSPCGGFDGASFIGGIVLALGVIVILVIIVKCYNHQSNKNELHYSQF